MDKTLQKRLELIDTLMHEKRRTSLAHTQYLSCNREYTEGEHLFMREVHFVVAVGPGSGKTMTQLAEALDVTRSAVSQLASRMEKKGYVMRLQSAEDKRQIITVLTEKGEALYAEHTAYDTANYQKISDLFSSFSDEDLSKFVEYEKLVRQCFTKKD